MWISRLIRFPASSHAGCGHVKPGHEHFLVAEPRLTHVILVLTGPQSLGQFEQVSTIGRVIGRTLRVEEILSDANRARSDGYRNFPSRLHPTESYKRILATNTANAEIAAAVMTKPHVRHPAAFLVIVFYAALSNPAPEDSSMAT